MVEITIPAQELYNEKENRFFDIQKPIKVELEHSLLAISKWESHFCKPFLDKKKKTKAEAIYYLKCMSLNNEIPEEAFFGVTDSELKKVIDYIDSPQTATVINDKARSKKGSNGETTTAELIYYWMNECNIPKECELWHLNRLMSLIEITSIKRQPEKKMSKRDIMSSNRALNAMRKARTGSKG